MILGINNKDRFIGLVADDFDLNSKSNAITGVATVNDKLIIMMNAAKLLDASEMESLEKAVKN